MAAQRLCRGSVLNDGLGSALARTGAAEHESVRRQQDQVKSPQCHRPRGAKRRGARRDGESLSSTVLKKGLPTGKWTAVEYDGAPSDKDRRSWDSCWTAADCRFTTQTK